MSQTTAVPFSGGRLGVNDVPLEMTYEYITSPSLTSFILLMISKQGKIKDSIRFLVVSSLSVKTQNKQRLISGHCP